jgi:hypothetical protein
MKVFDSIDFEEQEYKRKTANSEVFIKMGLRNTNKYKDYNNKFQAK